MDNDPPHSYPMVICSLYGRRGVRDMFAHSLLVAVFDEARYAPHAGFSYFVPLNSHFPDGILLNDESVIMSSPRLSPAEPDWRTDTSACVSGK
jgi:hypothetical protein